MLLNSLFLNTSECASIVFFDLQPDTMKCLWTKIVKGMKQSLWKAVSAQITHICLVQRQIHVQLTAVKNATLFMFSVCKMNAPWCNIFVYAF